LIATTDLDLWYHQNYYHDDAEEDLGDSSKVDDLVPGVLLGVSTALLDQYPNDTEDQVLDLEEANYSDTCEYDSRNDYDDGTYKGRYDVWKNCAPDQNRRVFVLAALPGDQSYLTVVQVVAASEADLEAQKHVLDTFKVSGAV
jgi:serine protease Do